MIYGHDCPYFFVFVLRTVAGGTGQLSGVYCALYLLARFGEPMRFSASDSSQLPTADLLSSSIWV
ncbi:MAG: hypothetical protein K6F01_11745 [Selenomonas sp.]|uniref:hypothetical protein n=1 Tax=Selenomonas sp. TaxID=2053611 RepID=UPI0025DF8104|nr:hypothetical protein [Selenomonas sp.]MCR5440086.1 hypothetical protein [Selenomonas sp.]